tara:strand:- start:311 stop:466 length:156 start_codon:yes stop_codon:yes gene_type:complete
MKGKLRHQVHYKDSWRNLDSTVWVGEIMLTTILQTLLIGLMNENNCIVDRK